MRKINRAIKIRIYLNTNRLKMPKMSAVRIKLHRPIPEEWKLKSVTVSHEPSGKYFACLLFYCENQAVEKAAYPMFYRRVKKKLARNQRKDFQHKLSSSFEEIYDAVCVEDLTWRRWWKTLFQKRCTWQWIWVVSCHVGV